MKKSTVTDNQEKKSPKKGLILTEELYASELSYRSLFESAKDGILILDAETGKIVDVNPFLMELLGYSKKEFIEKSIWEIGAFQDIIENKEKFLELKQKKYVRYEDLPLETSDGSKINVEFVSNVYLVNNNKVIQCNIRDITARKKTEAALEKTRKELAEIKETAEEINKFNENIINTVREPLLAIDKDLRVIKASRSFYKFFKVTAEETIDKLIYELGNNQWDIPKLRELLEEIIPEKNSFDDYEVEHNFSSIGKRVMLLNARQVKRAFGKEKVILLVIEDITERKAKEDALKQTHRATSDALNVLLNLMQAPIIIWDTSMIIKRFNHKFEQLSGYDSAEVIGKKMDFLFPKEKMAATLDLLKNHLDAEHLEVAEIDILTKDNNIKTVLWNSSRIFDEDGKEIVATISHDITSRKLLVDTLNFLETRYRRLFEAAQNGILILDAETGKIVDVNPFLVELLGYSKEEFIEKSIWEIGTFKDIYENKEKFFELQQKEYVHYDDLQLATSSGREIHVELVSNVYWANNIKVIQCNIRDITENLQIKKQVAESEEKFRTITENSADAIFITDKEGKYTYVNQEAVDLLGYSKEELLSYSIADISPKGRLEEYFQIFQQLAITGSSYSEIELVKKDGSYTDTDLNAVLLPNGLIYGSCRDISERKKAEKQIKEDLKIKTSLLQELYHRTKNNMAIIIAMLSMQSRRSDNEFVKTTFKDIMNRIKSMSLVHEKLYQAKDLSSIDLKDYIEDLTNQIKRSYGRLSGRIIFKYDMQEVKILIDYAIPLGLVINELITNIFKHAFTDRKEGEIIIKLHKEKDATINLELHDNGIGFPPNFELRKDASMGLLTVFSIVENQLKGKISVKSENGLHWQIKLKDKLKKARV